jgi:hypothetical protein
MLKPACFFSFIQIEQRIHDFNITVCCCSILDLLPRVVLTPDSPPLDAMRIVRTLYSPDCQAPDTNNLARTLFSPDSSALVRSHSFGPLYPLEERRESLEEGDEDKVEKKDEDKCEDKMEGRKENRIPVTLAFPTSGLRDSLCIQVHA